MTLAQLTYIPSNSRGHADHGWLRSAHSFSFADYYDPDRMHFKSLRVINDDWVAAGQGFPRHPHRDAEIFSYILEGTLEHKDSMGSGSQVKAGGIQYMSAGSGVTHSEFNPDPENPVSFLQVWLLPDERGVQPRYETMALSDADKRGKLALFLSKEGRDGSMKIRQDADIYAALLNGDERIAHTIVSGRSGWIQVAKGNLTVNGQSLSNGDAAAFEGGDIVIESGVDAEFLLFDLKNI